jgi:hypothetical protein
METPLAIGLVLFSVAIVFNAFVRLKGKCLFRHSYALSQQGSRLVNFYRTDSNGQKIPNSDFVKTKKFCIYKCTKCGHEYAESRFNDGSELELRTVESVKEILEEMRAAESPKGTPTANGLSAQDIKDLINANVKKAYTESDKIKEDVLLVPLIPEKKQ